MGRTDHRIRMVLLLLAFIVFAGAASARLGQLQVAERPSLLAHLASRAAAAAVGPVVRGRILDRNGTVLAQTAFVDRLVAWPRQVAAARRSALADELAGILGLDGQGREAIVRTLASDREYAVLARQLSSEESRAVREAIDARRLTGVALEPQQIRVYPIRGGEPGTSLASHLLGFVTADGAGRYGVEQAYDDLLSGRSGLMASVALPGGAGLSALGVGEPAGGVGQDIVLSIDAGLQLQLEKRLYHARRLDNAERVSGVVLDPDTGEVLAWASVPAYDGNRFAEVWTKDPERLSDPIAASVYEPGSVMKAFTAAAALSAGTVKPRTKVIDSPALRLDGEIIRNADRGAMGRLRFEDAIAYSRNVATAKVALRLEKTRRRSALRLYRTWSALGLGRPTGIDLAGEERGLVADPRKRPWSDLDLANRSFGQGVATTQVQLAAAYAAMVNGGLKVRPHVRLADTPEPAERERVLSPKVADQLRDILHRVTGAVPWYAQGSLIRGYEVGGKTGTAQIWDRRTGRYLPRVFNFSFVGYVGGDEPEALIAVRIHHTRPKVRGPGDLVLQIKSYELFRGIALDVIRTLAIPRAKAPGAGFPEPGSRAEKELYPDRARARAAAGGAGGGRSDDRASRSQESRDQGRRGVRDRRDRPPRDRGDRERQGASEGGTGGSAG
jgi:cell division protein FtsI/penicillin-binding protein 2